MSARPCAGADAGWPRPRGVVSPSMVSATLSVLSGALTTSTTGSVAERVEAESKRRVVLPVAWVAGSCARLTAAVCPRYRRVWPVRVFAVPHLGQRQSVGSMRDLDDVADVTGPEARHVSTVGHP